MDTQPIRTSEESMREMSRLPLIVGISVGVGATLVLLIAIVSCIALRMKRGRRRPAPSVMQVEEGTLETPTRPNLSATVRASEDAGIRRSTDERSSVRRNRLKRPAPTGAQMKPIRSPTTGTFPQTRPRADSTNRSATTVAAAVTAAAIATMMATGDTGNAQIDPAAASASAQQQQRERPKQPQYLHQHNNQPGPSRQPRRRPRSPESSRTPRQNQNQNQNQNQSGASSPTGERATWPNISSTVILASERRNNDDDNNNSNNNNRSYSYYPSFPASPPSSRPVTSDQRRPSTSGKASISHGTSRTLSPVPSFFYSATANGADDSQQGEGGEDVDLASPRPSSDLDHSPLDDLGFGSRATTAMARSPRSDILFAQSSGYNRIDREINLSPPSQVAASIGFGTQAQVQRPP
ncbi:hypothetical protein FRC18_008452 [Serendipita sp. 400]|nr:hypothetical protein FRC18_008452 [Serendipita sp. 400]